MEWEKKSKRLTPRMALQKAQNYCAYQDRCPSEVRTKLYEYGLYSTDVEAIIAELIGDLFINEERFAQSYARGKFRFNGWGRIKILLGLRQKQISEPNIKIGMKEIDPEEYAATLEDVIAKYQDKYAHLNDYERKAKSISYALSRGFEMDLILKIVNKE